MLLPGMATSDKVICTGTVFTRCDLYSWIHFRCGRALPRGAVGPAEYLISWQTVHMVLALC